MRPCLCAGSRNLSQGNAFGCAFREFESSAALYAFHKHFTYFTSIAKLVRKCVL